MILVWEPDPLIAAMTLKASTVFLRSRIRMSGQRLGREPYRVAQGLRFADHLNIRLVPKGAVRCPS